MAEVVDTPAVVDIREAEVATVEVRIHSITKTLGTLFADQQINQAAMVVVSNSR